MLSEMELREAGGLNPEPYLLNKAGMLFYNTSRLDMKVMMGDHDYIGVILWAYIQAFSPAVKDSFENFEFYTQIDKLAKA